jgi:DNA-binding transcriptional LysR family regulator
MALEWHVCASADYLGRNGTPTKAEDLDAHRLILFGGYRPPVEDIDWLADVGRKPGQPRRGVLEVNSLHGMMLAIKSNLGIAAVPEYMAAEDASLVRILPDIKAPKVDVYFVYPEELRNSKRVAVFRDFLLARLAERPH